MTFFDARLKCQVRETLRPIRALFGYDLNLKRGITAGKSSSAPVKSILKVQSTDIISGGDKKVVNFGSLQSLPPIDRK